MATKYNDSFMSRKDLMRYQDTLIMIFMRALQEVNPDVETEVRASISGGLFIQPIGYSLSNDEISEINDYMHKLVANRTRITCEYLKRDEAMARLKTIARPYLQRILAHLSDEDVVKFYDLDGYWDVFYSELPDNVGDIEVHDVIKYRDGILLRFPFSEDPKKMLDSGKTLYNALLEQSKWNNMLGVKYIDDLNRAIEEGRTVETILLSEALHDKKIVEMADEIVRRNKRIILILGPSSSGKTTFAKKLSLQLKVNGKSPLYLSTDDYFAERDETPVDENGKYDFESVNAIDIKLFTAQIEALLAGEEVDIPTFNFITGSKEFGKRLTRLYGDDPIIIEGIHAFNPALIGSLDKDEEYKIYISPLSQLNLTMHNRLPATETRLIRRMVRDARTRNHSAADTIRAWSDVRRGEEENIFPFAHEADVFFNTIQIYEAAVLKKYALPLLETVGPDEPEYEDAQRMHRLFSYISDIEDDDLIERDSILREFIGGSIFE